MRKKGLMEKHCKSTKSTSGKENVCHETDKKGEKIGGYKG